MSELKPLTKRINSEKGVELLEYIVVLVMLAIAFVWAGKAFQHSAESRGNMSMNEAKDMVPCDPSMPLNTGLGAEACK